MNDPARPPDPAPQGPGPRRLFLHEPGWRIGRKVGSTREFCYTIAPGQDYYHRLMDGEIYLYHGDERICLACAERRGLLAFEPRALREPGYLVDIVDVPAALADELFPGSEGEGDPFAAR